MARGAYSPSLDRHWLAWPENDPADGGIVAQATDPGFVGQTNGSEPYSNIGYYGSGSGGDVRDPDRLYLAYKQADVACTSSQIIAVSGINSGNTDRGDAYGYTNSNDPRQSGDDFFEVEDRLYFLSPSNSDYYYGALNMYAHPWGGLYTGSSTDFSELKGGRGGVRIQILNAGCFTKMRNFRNGSELNGRAMTGTHIFETNGTSVGDGYGFTPHVPVYASSDPGYPTDGSGESVEFYQGKTDENRLDEFKDQWDTVSLGLATAGADDCCFFSVSGFNCSTVIKIEMLVSHSVGGRSEYGFQFGNSPWIKSWGVPLESYDSRNTGSVTEANGNGNHGFILFHPFSGQFIWNNTQGDGYEEKWDYSVESFPDDIMFWDTEGTHGCPLPPVGGAAKDIKIFKEDGSSNTQGELESVVFYDN